MPAPRRTSIHPSRRLVASFMSREGHGKTHMLLTMPKPMVVIGLDPNTRSVVEKYYQVDDPALIDPAECRYIDVPYPLMGFSSGEDEIKEESIAAWAQIDEEVYAVHQGKAVPPPRSFLIDSGTMLDRLNILREFGRMDKIAPKVRRNKLGTLNNEFRGLFDALQRAGVHVGLTHRVRERWETVEVRGGGEVTEKDQVVPGVYDPLGFKEIGYMCNVEVLMLFDPDRGGKLSNKFGMRITRARERPALIGREYWGKAEVEGQVVSVTSVPYLGTLLYPGTTLQEWE